VIKLVPSFLAGWLAMVAFRSASEARPWPAVICGVASGLLCALVIYRIAELFYRRRPS
jgi:hypothetical protein